jgi:hypothetical protein
MKGNSFDINKHLHPVLKLTDKIQHSPIKMNLLETTAVHEVLEKLQIP